MAEPRKQQSPFSLLDLPDAAIDGAIAEMARTNKPRFMAACRKAARMTMADGVTLKLTKHSKFSGIKKVAASKTLQALRQYRTFTLISSTISSSLDFFCKSALAYLTKFGNLMKSILTLAIFSASGGVAFTRHVIGFCPAFLAVFPFACTA